MDVGREIVGGGTVEDERSLMEKHDPRGKGLDLFRPVGGKKDGLSRSMDFFQQKVDLLRHLKVEARRRLIEEEKRRVGQEGTADADPLLQPLRQELHLAATKRLKVEFIQRLFDPRRRELKQAGKELKVVF